MKRATPRDRRLQRERAERNRPCEPLAVHPDRLAPDGSYGVPDFVTRGTYIDKPFICADCGVRENWRASQQRWWYEVAKGGVWTTAMRCRACRRRERERRENARRVHLKGLKPT